MSNLSKLTVKTVARATTRDPIEQRRHKLVLGVNEQLKVHAAAIDGKDYEVERKSWTKNEQGEKVLVERGIEVEQGTGDAGESGPAHITLTDPDGNPILIDQFF